MRFFLRFFITFALLRLTVEAATIGTVTNVTGGVSDMVLDEPRQRLYLVRPSPYDAIDVYSITQRRVISSIRTDSLPLAAALSRDGSRLYVTCHNSSSLNVIDNDKLVIVGKVSLPARPEGVGVGSDGRVLVTTIGSGQNNLLNTLLIYNPAIVDLGTALVPVAVAPPPPLAPNLPPLAGRIYLANRSQLVATPDGTKIIGVNAYTAANRVVFVYDAKSGTVPKSREVGDLSTNISVSPDGSRFMLGLRLFETSTLSILAAQNAANSLFPFSATVNAQGFVAVGQQFNLQQNQGGSAFAPDGSRIYSAFNIAPIQSPAVRPNVTTMLASDPDNLFMDTALELPENLAGKILVTANGRTLYTISESGFLTIPLDQVAQNPILRPLVQTIELASDQCKTSPEGSTGSTILVNDGATPPAGGGGGGFPGGGGGGAPGGVTATLTLLQSLGGAANTPGLGQVGGFGGIPIGGFPGGGIPGGGGIIIVAPTVPNGQIPNGLNNAQAQITNTAPGVNVSRNGNNTVFNFTFNSAVTRSLGTVAAHDFIISSAQSVNISPRIRVYQNSRNSEARGRIQPIDTSLSPNEALVDMVQDTVRQKLYIANSGMNRIEIFDTATKKLLKPVKVGQLPRSLAMSPDGGVLYVANSGSEYISVVDLDKLTVVSRIVMPPLPFNGFYNPIQPSIIVSTQRGPLALMSNGTLWRVVGNELVPRPTSQIIGTATIAAPRSMAATPNGEFALLLAGNGNAYLYDASVDDFVQARSVASAPITGYYGPVTAGPRGQYFVANGLVLNQSLSPISGTDGSAGGIQTRTTTAGSISAVANAGGTTYARFSQPARANANALMLDVPVIELVDVNTGNTMRSSPALEGPLSQIVGTTRTNVDARTLAIDTADNTAYAITSSGLSIIPIDVPLVTDRPVPARNGVVNVGSYNTTISPNGLISIFGQNLGASATASTSPLPTFLGGVCLTLGQVPLPLLMTSPGQINAVIPFDTAVGRNTLVVRNVDKKIASTSTALTIAKYAPAVLADPTTKEALVFKANGERISKKNQARRDEPIVMYAVGLGVPKGAKLTAGGPAPSTTLIETDALKVFFGDYRYKEAEIIVDWSGFAPGFVGLYQINMRVPGAHIKGEALPVMIRIGSVDSPLTGVLVPTIAVQ